MKNFLAYDDQGPMYIPDMQVILKASDKLIPLCGYKYVKGVKRKGKLVGWAIHESKKS